MTGDPFMVEAESSRKIRTGATTSSFTNIFTETMGLASGPVIKPTGPGSWLECWICLLELVLPTYSILQNSNCSQSRRGNRLLASRESLSNLSFLGVVQMLDGIASRSSQTFLRSC